METAIYETGFRKSHNLEEVLASLVADSGYSSGRAIVKVFENEESENERGSIVVSFFEKIIFAKFDYNGVVKAMIRGLSDIHLRIEVIERVEAVEEEA